MKTKCIGKKILCMFLVATTLVSVNTVSVFAARPPFSFNLYAYDVTTKWTDNYVGNSNPKTIAGDDWTLILNTLYFSDSNIGVGMAYAMFRNNTQKSGIMWRKKTGTYYGGWNAPTGYYYNLKGRLDTDASGYCISNGIYNADRIS